MAEDSWGVHFEGNKQLEDQLFALIQDKLRQIGGIDEDFLTSVIGIIMININRSTKRTAKDTRNDLEEILDEEVFKKTIAWLEDEFMAKARELAQQAQAPAPQIAKPDSTKAQEQPKLTPPKPAVVQPTAPAPQEQAVSAQQPAATAEIKTAPNTQQQQHLSKRPPEKKAAGDEEKKSIFDRIKLNREPKTDNGGKSKQTQQKFDRHPQTHAHKRPQEAAGATEEADELKKQIKESPEEEAQRQVRLDELLSKAKKRKKCMYFPNCRNQECEFVHPEEKCPWFPKCMFGESCFYIHPEIPCKFGYHCQRENCSYRHPPNFKFAVMQGYHQSDSSHKPAPNSLKPKRPSPQTNFNSTTQAAGGD